MNPTDVQQRFAASSQRKQVDTAAVVFIEQAQDPGAGSVSHAAQLNVGAFLTIVGRARQEETRIADQELFETLR